MAKLSDKQELFCLEYLKDLNATQAAIRAKYSVKTAGHIGLENLQKPGIQSRLQQLNGKRLKNVGLQGEDVLKELQKIAFSDVTDYTEVAEGGEVTAIPLNEIKNTQAVKKIKSHRRITESKDGEKLFVDDNFEIELWDKPKALDALGRHFKLFTDKIEIDASDALSELLKAARERNS